MHSAVSLSLSITKLVSLANINCSHYLLSHYCTNHSTLLDRKYSQHNTLYATSTIYKYNIPYTLYTLLQSLSHLLLFILCIIISTVSKKCIPYISNMYILLYVSHTHTHTQPYAWQARYVYI